MNVVSGFTKVRIALALPVVAVSHVAMWAVLHDSRDWLARQAPLMTSDQASRAPEGRPLLVTATLETSSDAEDEPFVKGGAQAVLVRHLAVETHDDEGHVSWTETQSVGGLSGRTVVGEGLRAGSLSVPASAVTWRNLPGYTPDANTVRKQAPDLPWQVYFDPRGGRFALVPRSLAPSRDEGGHIVILDVAEGVPVQYPRDRQVEIWHTGLPRGAPITWFASRKGDTLVPVAPGGGGGTPRLVVFPGHLTRDAAIAALDDPKGEGLALGLALLAVTASMLVFASVSATVMGIGTAGIAFLFYGALHDGWRAALEMGGAALLAVVVAAITLGLAHLEWAGPLVWAWAVAITAALAFVRLKTELGDRLGDVADDG